MSQAQTPAVPSPDGRGRPGGDHADPIAHCGATTTPLGGRSDWAAAGLLVLLVVLFFWRTVFLGEVFLPLDLVGGLQPWVLERPDQVTNPYWNPLPGDAVTQVYPETVSSQRRWADGLPLWEPDLMTGMPALATGRTYSSPIVVLLSRVLAADRALTLSTLLYALVAALGCFLLLRELGCGRFGALVGSTVFTFNAYLVGWYSLNAVVGAWVWLPLVLFGFEAALGRRDPRWALAGGVAFGLQILSGYPLWAFYGGAALALYATALAGLRAVRLRRWRAALAPLGYGALIGSVGAALAAPLLLLTAELFGQTTRTRDLFAGYFNPCAEMVRLVVPQLWGVPLHGGSFSGWHNYVETTLYVGILPLLFVGCSLRARREGRPAILVGIGLLTYLAAFGVPPAAQIIGWLSPFFLKTYPGRVFYVTTFAWSVAAGLGADWLERTRPAALLRCLGAGATGAAALLLAGAAFVTLRGRPPLLVAANVPEGLLSPGTAPGRSVLLAVVWLLLAASLLWLWTSAHRRWVTPALLALTVADLFALGLPFNPSFPRTRLFPDTPSLTALRELVAQEDQPCRVLPMRTREILPGQIPEIWDLATPTGYSSWVLNRYVQYTRLIPGKADWEIQIHFDDCCHPLLDALNVRYVYAGAGRIPTSVGRLRLDRELHKARVRHPSGGAVKAAEWRVEGLDQPVIAVSGHTRVLYRLSVPEGARLRTAIGLRPDVWSLSDGLTFTIRAVAGPSTDRQTLFSLRLDPKTTPEHRGFVPVEVNLGRFAGSEIDLILVTAPGRAGDPTRDLGAWLDPVVESEALATLELVRDGPNRIYRNRNALPRAWIVRCAIEVGPGDLDHVRRVLTSPEFQPASTAVVEGRLPGPLGVAHPDDRVRFTSYRAERAELDVSTAEPGLLVVSDMVYPGWHALVDGVERPILPTNMIMRAVYLEAGSHQVVFEYRPTHLRGGVVIALTGLAGTLLLFAVATLRKRRLSPPAPG